MSCGRMLEKAPRVFNLGTIFCSANMTTLPALLHVKLAPVSTGQEARWTRDENRIHMV
jgi:hypothetical protein